MKISECSVPLDAEQSTSASDQFSVPLPVDAKVQCVYQRDGRFYFLCTYEHAAKFEQRNFYVHWCSRNNLNHESETLHLFRYIGGDTHLGTTYHFFEILKEEKTS